MREDQCVKITTLQVLPLQFQFDQFILHYVQILLLKLFIQYIHIQMNQDGTTLTYVALLLPGEEKKKAEA